MAGEPSDSELFSDAVADETVPPSPAPASEPEATEAQQPRDEQGRFAPVTQPAAEAAQQPDQQATVHTVPLMELLAIRDRAQAAERERDQYRQRLAEYERQQLEARARQQQQRPDLITQPEQAWAYMEQQIRQARAEQAQETENKFIDLTFARVHQAYGDDFMNAYQALKNEVDQGYYVNRQRIVRSPDPGEALMRWWGEIQAYNEIGGDFAGYKQRYRQQLMADPQFRQEFAALVRQEAQQARSGNGGRSQLRSIPSLTRSTGASDRGGEVEDLSEGDLLKTALRRK